MRNLERSERFFRDFSVKWQGSDIGAYFTFDTDENEVIFGKNLVFRMLVLGMREVTLKQNSQLLILRGPGVLL